VTGDGTARERETALRELLALIAQVALVPVPAVPEPFDCERHLADTSAWNSRQRAFAIMIQGASEYAATGDVRDIRIATEVLRQQTATALPYEPYPDREAGS
jgi:hypothetical protein